MMPSNFVEAIPMGAPMGNYCLMHSYEFLLIFDLANDLIWFVYVFLFWLMLLFG